MKNLAFIILFLLISCKENNVEKPKSNKNLNKTVKIQPEVDLKELESNFAKWWNYYSDNILLTSSFKGVDENLDTIYKEEFLKKLTTGNFIPLKIESQDKIGIYKLYKLDSSASKSISNTIKNESSKSLELFKMEGESFPEFEFKDIKGNKYNKRNTAGKTIILKTWFINCAACIAEFTELNELVDKYKNNKDFIFLSLAIDSKDKLERFLKKKDFKYVVVSDQKEFIESTLNSDTYPTHIIINNSGIIEKVTNKASVMISFLENEKKEVKNFRAPPSPM